MNILLTGAYGNLGTELRKLRHFEFAPTHEEMNITTNELGYYFNFSMVDLIVHCAAYTNVEQAEIEKEICYDVNVNGTANLSELDIPILYISTEYVFDGEKGMYTEQDIPNPKNFYSLTKLLGEYRLYENSKILRLLFKPRPWRYPKAFVDQWTSGDYVDVIAKEINIAIDLFDQLPMITNIGTGRKTIYDLAKQTRNVGKISRGEIKTYLPKDVSLNTQIWEALKMEYNK